MRVERIIASVLLSVFFWTPLAPAALVPSPLAPQHCDRKPLARTESLAAMPGMDCHAMAAHSHHPAPPVPATAPSSDHQVGSNGCCTSHDCCNSTVRSQWAHLVPTILVTVFDLVQTASTASPIIAQLAPRFDSNFSRAPPAL